MMAKAHIFVFYFAILLALFAALEKANAETQQIEQKPETAILTTLETKDTQKQDTQSIDSVTGNSEQHKPSFKSVFFSNDDLDNIAQVKTACEKMHSNTNSQGLDEDDFLKKLEMIANVKPNSPTFTYPQFFLASIAYHSPTDWTVWVNGEKITPNSGISPSKLKITDIKNDRVTFEWIPERMDKITDIGEQIANNPIKVDTINGRVIFTLKGNQTFTTYAMKIVEGKVKQMTTNNNQENNPPANNSAINKNQDIKTTQKIKSEEGLKK